MREREQTKNTPNGATPDEKREKRRQRYAAYRVVKHWGEKPENFAPTIKRIVPAILKCGPKLYLVIAAAIVGTVLSIIGPSLLGDAVDALQTQVEIKLSGGSITVDSLLSLIFKLFVVYGIAAVLSYIEQYTMAGITQKIIRELRANINTRLMRLPLKFFDSHAKGELLSRIMNDVDNVSNTLQHNLISVISSIIMIVGVFCIMLYLDITMTLVTVAVVPPAAFISMKILKVSKKLFRAQWDRMGELNGHVEEMYAGHKIVKLFDREDSAIEEFNDINSELYDVSRRAQFVSGTIQPFLSFVNNLGYVLVCIVGGYLVVSSDGDGFTLGGITAFIAYSKMFTQPMVDLAQITNNLQSSLASMERVYSVLDEPEDSDIDGGEAPTFEHELSFNDVFFSYSEDKPLIEHMDFSVKPGQLTAIVGPTGAGKTTFVNLLMRFYDVSSGKITLDGKDIREYSRDSLRSLFGMVLQDTWLFEGTVRENLRYGRLEATDEEIEVAAKNARAHNFIMNLNGGYDAVLEENGANLSQGQRQLLTIARALVKNPKILILDEATSSVDTRTELLVQQAMSEAMKGRTNFVIAHRLSTIRRADEILFIDNGVIKERGTHSELIEAGGYYADMYNSQFSGHISKVVLETDNRLNERE